MATMQAYTTSNNPQVTLPDQLTNLLDAWDFIPVQGEIYAGVRDGHLHIHGKSGFSPYPAEVSIEKAEEFQDPEAFLEAVADYLAEPLVVQTISHTKLRYPFGGAIHVARPDGFVKCRSFHKIAHELLEG